LEIQPVVCIKGVVRKDWLVLPVVAVKGVQCAAFSARRGWLHQLVGGRNETAALRAQIRALVQACLAAFKVGPASTSGPELVGVEPSAPAAPPVAAGDKVKKGRAAILSESDSEEEGDARQQRPKKTPRLCGPRAGDFVKRTVEGIELAFTVSGGRKVLVPVEGPTIQHMAEHLYSRRGEEVAATASTDSSDAASSQDKGRVFWRAGSGYQVCYQDGEGKKRWTRAGLSMPHRSLTGEPLTDEEHRKTREVLRQKARRLWDSSDCSEAPRFGLG
jgi:hypothetical protein